MLALIGSPSFIVVCVGEIVSAAEENELLKVA